MGAQGSRRSRRSHSSRRALLDFHAGAVTKRLRQELRARMTIAGQNVTATVKVGGVIGARAAPRKRSSSGTTP